MADNFLENKYEDYLLLKKKWIEKKKNKYTRQLNIERPEDEAL